MRYKAIVFDFFGVICSEISPFWFEEHFAEKGKELRQQYLQPGRLSFEFERLCYGARMKKKIMELI